MAAADPGRWHEVNAAVGEEQVAQRILELVGDALQQAGIRPIQRRSA